MSAFGTGKVCAMERKKLDPFCDATVVAEAREAPQGAAQRAARGVERRSEPRIPHRAIVVMPFGEGMRERFENAQLLDCTAHGVALVVSQPLRPRTRFFLKLKLSAIALVVYEVRNCQQVPDGYRIGAEFVGVIGKELDRDSTPESILTALLAT